MFPLEYQISSLKQIILTMRSKFDISDYDDRYFKWHRDYTRDYAIRTMDWYIKLYNPTSVVDFGCGVGAYLESALNNDILDILGFDIGGDVVKKYTEPSIHPYIQYLDCTKELFIEKNYDCVISLETGEHIETESSDQFVLNIVGFSKKTGTILFSAAPPGQTGTGHINCQTKEFWIEKFSTHSWNVDKETTDFIKSNWSNLKAPDYIVKNLIVFKYK